MISSPDKCSRAELAEEQRLAAAVLVGLLNRQAQAPVALGKINQNDAAWLDDAKAEEPALNASNFQEVSSFEELAHIAADSGEWGPYVPSSICRMPL